VAVEYWRGVRFVAEYYHRGCPSWSWVFPWHYAPLARDLVPGGAGITLTLLPRLASSDGHQL